MKLAEALAERADLQTRLAQLRGRLQRNAKVQEGEQPAEQPEALLAELDEMTARLETLIAQINRTNTATLDGGESMTELLARRDVATLKIGILRDFLAEASDTVRRSTLNEIKVQSTVPVAKMQKALDAQSKALRELDVRIQSLNWSTELI